MESINKNNYEAWLLDYVEGNLTAQEEMKVDQFLEQEPSIKAELEAFEPVYLEPDNSITFDKKELLKKKDKGRVVYFNWKAMAVAAAILLGIVAIAPLFFNNSTQNPTAVASSKAPLWERPEIGAAKEDAGSTTAPANQVDQQLIAEKGSEAPATPAGEKGNDQQPANNAGQVPTVERESIAGLTALQPETAESITVDHSFYYYDQSSVLATVDPNPRALDHEFENQPARREEDGLLNNILKSEVARAFIPESFSDELPEKSKGGGGFAPTIYLELPPAGKKIVDKILK